MRRNRKKKRRQSIRNSKSRSLYRASSIAKGSEKSGTYTEKISSWRGNGNCNRSKCREGRRAAVPVGSIANEGEERRNSRRGEKGGEVKEDKQREEQQYKKKY